LACVTIFNFATRAILSFVLPSKENLCPIRLQQDTSLRCSTPFKPAKLDACAIRDDYPPHAEFPDKKLQHGLQNSVFTGARFWRACAARKVNRFSRRRRMADREISGAAHGI
jgi:hypothetical protein